MNIPKTTKPRIVVIGGGCVGKIGEDIKKRVAQMKETREARVERNSLLDGVNSDDDDLVL